MGWNRMAFGVCYIKAKRCFRDLSYYLRNKYFYDTVYRITLLSIQWRSRGLLSIFSISFQACLQILHALSVLKEAEDWLGK